MNANQAKIDTIQTTHHQGEYTVVTYDGTLFDVPGLRVQLLLQVFYTPEGSSAFLSLDPATTETFGITRAQAQAIIDKYCTITEIIED